jgi:class 3 adenylate cyclase
MMQIQLKNREPAILIIVSVLALIANLPESVLGHMVDRDLLLITLFTLVVISLFHYLEVVLLVTTLVLVIGANLSTHAAEQLGISQPTIWIVLVILLLIVLLYKYKFHYLIPQNEIDKVDAGCARQDNLDTRNMVTTAIINRDTAKLHQLLLSNIEINFSQNGTIPLFLAIENGYADIVLLLISFGANIWVKNNEGRSPIEFALLHEKMRIAEIILYTSRQKRVSKNVAEHHSQQTDKVAVLFADICGSSALYEQFGNESALRIITRTLNILIQEVATYKGNMIKTIGDEVMCSFPSIELAAQAACAMHFAVDALRPGGELPINLRIGFHYGEVIRRANDVFGDTVNIAARVTSITRARQITTTQIVIDALPSAYANRVRPITRSASHGKQDSSSVFQILWEPENKVSDRIGQLAYRKKKYSGSNMFSNEF